MSTPDRGASDFERPVLAGGERLRQEIERATGGAEKFHPFSFDEARAILGPQVAAVREAAAATSQALRGTRLVIEATLLPNYLANSYFPSALMDAADLIPIGTRTATATYRTPASEREEAPTKTLILAGTDASLERLAAVLDAPASIVGRMLQENVREIAEIKLPALEDVLHVHPESDVHDPDMHTFESVLHPPVAESGLLASEEADTNFRKWASLIETLGGQVIENYRRPVAGLTFVPVRLPMNRVRAAARFNPLRAIRPMPQLRPLPLPPLRAAGTLQPPVPPPPGEAPPSDIRVAVFDGGVDRRCPFLAPFVRLIDATSEPEDPEYVAHGTAVTSAAMFGEPQPGEQLQTPAAVVDHFRVLPPPPDPWDLELYWVLDRIVEAVEAGAYDIVNLSIGPFTAVDDGDPHRWTAELDRLGHARDVLFVSAAGNNGELDATLGLNRIQVPSDMVNGLAVGACGVRDRTTWTRAPYSAVGPGRPGGRVRPTGVSFGGSDPEEFMAMIGSGRWAEGQGTSYATPLVVRGLTALAAGLGRPRTRPNTLRAAAVHFTKPPDPHLPTEHGFGRFQDDYATIWGCDEHEVTVLYEDQLERDQMVALPLPVPDGVLDGMMASVRWTLAFSSAVDPTDAVDYTRSGVDIQFRPHDRRYNFTMPDGSVVGPYDTQEQAPEVTGVLRSGGRPSVHPATRSPGGARLIEADRRDEGKWETMVQLTHRMRGQGLFRPRVDLSFLARDSGLLVREAVPPLDYTLIATIRGRQGTQLYNAVRASYPVLVPVQLQLPVRVRA